MSKRKPKASFEQLIAQVQFAEEALEAQERRTGEEVLRLKQSWRAAWTPARIVSAGLVTGFLVGRAEPLAKVSGARWMQMITTVSGFFTSIQAAIAANEAEDAADEVEDMADEADDGAGPELHIRVAPTEQVRGTRAHTGEWSSEPRPAEAATEVSERYTDR